jgi:hypothetical protein
MSKKPKMWLLPHVGALMAYRDCEFFVVTLTFARWMIFLPVVVALIVLVRTYA